MQLTNQCCYLTTRPHDPTITDDPAEWNSLSVRLRHWVAPDAWNYACKFFAGTAIGALLLVILGEHPQYLSTYEAAMFGLLHRAHTFIPPAAIEEIRCFLSDCIQLTAGRNKIEELGDIYW